MKTIILTFLAVCCLPFFFVGLYEAYQNNQAIKNFTHTEGTVVGNSYTTTYEDGNAVGSYLPQVEFTTTNGKNIRFTDQIGSLPPDYEIGSKVQIIYQPANPTNARIHSLKRLWLAPTIFMTVGLLPMIIGLIIIWHLKI